MKNIIRITLLFLLIVPIYSPLFGISYLSDAYKKYLEWRLGNEIVESIKTCRESCDPIYIIDTKYQAPTYIQWLNKLPLLGKRESDTEYVKHLYEYLDEYVDKAFYIQKEGRKVLFFEDFIEKLQENINKGKLPKPNKEILVNYVKTNYKNIKKELNSLEILLGELNTHIINALQAQNIVLTIDQLNKDKTLAIRVITQYPVTIVNEYKKYDIVAVQIKQEKEQEEFKSELKSKINQLIIDTLKPYMENFRLQKKYIENLTPETIKPVSWIERWHRNRMIQRLKDLKNWSTEASY
ncbi:MAG TPA: hypothetical protein VGW78_01375 [Candidatus Babeliales bacterium]|jgi:hypothetical protein|nr:hypothetical protein [Candidatus Babeliales bacterium]